jgi:hypothetical protein
MTVPALVARINAAEQRMKIERFDIAEAERQLEAIVREEGVSIPPGILDGLLPEARHRVEPRLNMTGRLPFLGTTT